MPATSNVRITRTHSCQIHAPRAEVFPLLCPTREHEWLEPWTATGSGHLYYSASGYNEQYCMFESKIIPMWGPEIWITSRFDPDAFTIQFIRVQPDTVVIISDVSLVAREDGTTQYELTETLTALTDAGADILEGLTQEAFDMHMGVLTSTLDHFCRTGEMLAAG